jgi:hypothetical protein
MQGETIVQLIAAGIVVVVNCMTVGIGMRAIRDLHRRIRALEARSIEPPQVMYMQVRPDYYHPPPSAPMPVTYDPV